MEVAPWPKSMISEETGAGCDGAVAIDRAVAERGDACWPADQSDRAGL